MVMTVPAVKKPAFPENAGSSAPVESKRTTRVLL